MNLGAATYPVNRDWGRREAGRAGSDDCPFKQMRKVTLEEVK